jgi:hypothetical protein
MNSSSLPVFKFLCNAQKALRLSKAAIELYNKHQQESVPQLLKCGSRSFCVGLKVGDDINLG